jgi:hypothetical protein
MISTSNLRPLSAQELADYGHAIVRDLAFDVVRSLWDKRHSAGMKQFELAERIGKDPAWISRNLRGPGNWTFRTFGAFLAALDAEVEMTGHLLNDGVQKGTENFHAYDEFVDEPTRTEGKTANIKMQGSVAAPGTAASKSKVKISVLEAA